MSNKAKKQFSFAQFFPFKMEENYLRLFSYLIISLVVVYLRPDAFYHAQFWGDEGRYFYADAFNEGISSLFNTCNGYFHLFPRFIAWLTVAFALPLHLVPFVFTYTWWILLLCLSNFIWKRTPFSDQQKFYLIISMVLIPMHSEIIMNLTNLQWILALFPFVLFSFPVKKLSKTTIGINYVIVVLCGLSGPNYIILIPFFIWQFIMGSRHNLYGSHYKKLFGAAIAIGALGAFALYNNEGFIRVQGGDYSFGTGVIKYVFMQYAFVFVGAYCTDFNLTTMVMTVILIALLFIYLLFVAKDKEGFRKNVMLFGVLYLLSVIITYGNTVELMNPYYYSPRNFYLPALASVWLIILYSEKWAYRMVLRAVLLFWMALQTHWYVGSQVMDDQHLNEYTKKLKTSDTLRVPIQPQGWSIFLDKHCATP